MPSPLVFAAMSAARPVLSRLALELSGFLMVVMEVFEVDALAKDVWSGMVNLEKNTMFREGGYKVRD